MTRRNLGIARMRTMPGLGSVPAAARDDIDADGRTVGLF
jgi:formyltetrahydrofolate synthetase